MISWSQKSCGILQRETCWKTEERYPKKMTIICENTVLCMKTFSAADCERLWKNKKEKWRGWTRESKRKTKRKKAKVTQERWREKERGLKSKEGVWIGKLVMFSKVSASWMSGRVTEIPWFFGVCVYDVFFCYCCVWCVRFSFECERVRRD